MLIASVSWNFKHPVTLFELQYDFYWPEVSRLHKSHFVALAVNAVRPYAMSMIA